MAAGFERCDGRLEHDVIGRNRHHALAFCLSMISAQTRSAFVARENRFPPIGSSPRACFSESCSSVDRLLARHGLRASLRIQPLWRRCGNICPQPSLGRRRAATALQEVLIGEYTDEDHRPHDRKVERAWDAQQIDEVLQHLEQDRTEHNAYDRAFAATQRAAAEHGGGDRVELVEGAVHRRRD